jgi:hypothetical protein
MDQAILQLSTRRDLFDEIVIETTGLADPFPISQTLLVLTLKRRTHRSSARNPQQVSGPLFVLHPIPSANHKCLEESDW